MYDKKLKNKQELKLIHDKYHKLTNSPHKFTFDFSAHDVVLQDFISFLVEVTPHVGYLLS